MVTIWPRQSTTARSVRVNAAEAIGSGRSASTRSTSGRSWPSPVDPNSRPAARPAICKVGSTNGSRSNASASLPIGNDASRNDHVDVLGDAAGPDQDQPLHQLRELVGELHRHPAAKRVTDDGDPLDVEHGKQVAHPVGVRRDRVVGAWLVRLPVAQQVDGDHREPLRELGLNRLPGGGVVTDPVNQQDHRARAGDPERTPIAVDRAELQRRGDFPHRAQIGRLPRPACASCRQLRCRARWGCSRRIVVVELLLCLLCEESLELRAEFVAARQILIPRQQRPFS